MNYDAAKRFIVKNARPLEQALYSYYFENGSKENILRELKKFQNEDGGFGNGLELDNWNPLSNPIATNDAIMILHRLQALGETQEMVNGILSYLKSHDSFDEEKKRWLFAIESNKEYPHAVWWEKEGDGISSFNPTVSLAAFMVCFGERSPYYEEIIREAFAWLEEKAIISGDTLKCFALCYDLLLQNQILDIVDLEEVRALLTQRIQNTICKDTSKYGVEYVSVPSDFFAVNYAELINSEIQNLIAMEKEMLGKLQKGDGGFDISWEWHTDYAEFSQARQWWRARITIDKLLFDSRH